MDTPQQPISFGQKRVRTGFNPSREQPVDRVKEDTANLLNELHTAQEIATDPEQKRLVSLAMTAYEEACMWAVKALTHGK